MICMVVVSEYPEVAREAGRQAAMHIRRYHSLTSAGASLLENFVRKPAPAIALMARRLFAPSAGIRRNNFRPAACDPVPMRDGVHLFANVFRTAIRAPRRSGRRQRMATILIRTPYGKGLSAHGQQPEAFVEHGYAVVVQDVRGRQGISRHLLAACAGDGTMATTPSTGSRARPGRTERWG